MGLKDIVENFANSAFTTEELNRPAKLGELNVLRTHYLTMLKHNDDRTHAVIRAHNKEKDRFMKKINKITAENEKRSIQQSKQFFKLLKDVQDMAKKQLSIESNQDLLLAYMKRILKSNDRHRWTSWETLLTELYEENKTHKLLKRIKALSKADQNTLNKGMKLAKEIKGEK